MAGISADAEPSVAATAAAPEWVVFRSGSGRFGVPIRTVREIIVPRPLSRLPGCGPEVRGLIGVRGRIVTVLDFAAAVGLAPAAPAAGERLLLIEDDERLAGFAVEEVIGVAPRAPDELPLPAETLRGLDVDRGDVYGVGELHGQPFLAIDPRRLMQRLLI